MRPPTIPKGTAQIATSNTSSEFPPSAWYRLPPNQTATAIPKIMQRA